MNKKLTFLLGFMLLSFSFQTMAQKSFDSPEELAKYAFKALIKEDHKKFEKIFPIEEDVEFLAQKQMETGGEDAVNEFRERAGKMMVELSENCQTELMKIITIAKSEGVNIEESEYYKAVYNVKKVKGVPFTDIKVIIKYQDILYSVKVDDCVKVDRGWISTGEPRWKGTYEEN